MRRAVGPILALAFVAALLYATLAETAVECDVCLDFDGRRECRSATAVDRDAAVRSAITNACALLASGVTQSIRCDRTPPSSVACRP